MKKANQYFFLNAVNDHIVVSMLVNSNPMMLTFCDEAYTLPKHKKAFLKVVATPNKTGYILDYKVTEGHKVIAVGESTEIPKDEIYGVIAGFVNAVFE